MINSKLYCFVDETGQDTLGKFFLVAVVLKEKEAIDTIATQLEKIEKASKKNLLKWNKTPFEVRNHYLSQLVSIKELKGAVFYSSYHETKEYIPLISLTIAKAVLSKKEDHYHVHIIIDGLTKKGTEGVSQELKKLKVRYKRIRGMKDEQHSILRLADAIAGFLRDCAEKQSYTKALLKRLQTSEIIIEA